MASRAGHFLSQPGTVDERVEALRKYHRDKRTWRNNSEWYWWWRFMQEVWELTLSLIGLHKDPPELELLQLAAMASNWIEMREDTK